CAQRGFDHAENLRPAANCCPEETGRGRSPPKGRAGANDVYGVGVKKIVVLAVAKGESRLRPSPAKLRWDAPAGLALARRIRWSICAPHAGQFDVGVTLFLEVPFRQLWCITSLSGKSAPALTGPRQVWCAPHPRGSAFGLVPGEVPLVAGIISARMPVPYPRMKTGSRVSDTRLMASNFYIAQLRFFGQPMVMAQKSGRCDLRVNEYTA